MKKRTESATILPELAGNVDGLDRFLATTEADRAEYARMLANAPAELAETLHAMALADWRRIDAAPVDPDPLMASVNAALKKSAAATLEDAGYRLAPDRQWTRPPAAAPAKRPRR